MLFCFYHSALNFAIQIYKLALVFLWRLSIKPYLPTVFTNYFKAMFREPLSLGKRWISGTYNQKT